MSTRLDIKLVAKGPGCQDPERHTMEEIVAHVEFSDGGRRWLMNDGCVLDIMLREVKP